MAARLAVAAGAGVLLLLGASMLIPPEAQALLDACGNGRINRLAGEECDGAALGGATCESQGFDSGTLACTADCRFDTTGCTSHACAADLAACQSDLETAQQCGNGLVEEGENCDIGNLAGATCADAGFAFGTLACGAGCVFDTSGCTNQRFFDTGLTIIDNETGLEWEKKTNDNTTVHDVDGTYAWTSTGTAPDGPLFTSFVNALNSMADCTSVDGRSVTCSGSCFAGHCDWRVPEIGELRTILDTSAGACAGGSGPCVNPAFNTGCTDGCTSCSCTVPSFYWSASTRPSFDPFNAWGVNFGNGSVGIDGKAVPLPARGVRGGNP